MKIILLDKIQRLGEIGDIVEVNSGYARNFFFYRSQKPEHRFRVATSHNRIRFSAELIILKTYVPGKFHPCATQRNGV